MCRNPAMAELLSLILTTLFGLPVMSTYCPERAQNSHFQAMCSFVLDVVLLLLLLVAIVPAVLKLLLLLSSLMLLLLLRCCCCGYCCYVSKPSPISPRVSDSTEEMTGSLLCAYMTRCR